MFRVELPDTIEESSEITRLKFELQRASTENQQLSDEVRAVRHENEQLRSRLKKFLSVRSDQPSSQTSIDSMAHIALADRFRDLVAQDLQHLAREHHREFLAEPTSRRLARQIRSLCQDLFKEQLRSAKVICERHGMDRVRHEATVRELIDKVGDLFDQSDGVHWDFQTRSKAVLDPSYQEPWGQCDPLAEVEFAVAPAYRFGTRLYVKQLVFTTPKRSLWRL